MIRFYGKELLAPRPTPKLGDHPLSAARNCLFNIFAPTLHVGDRSSIRNLRTRHAVVKGTHLSRHLWDNVEKYLEPEKPQMTIWCRHISCWIPKATKTRSEYIILVAFLLQQLLQQCALVLLCTYVAFFASYHVFSRCFFFFCIKLNI